MARETSAHSRRAVAGYGLLALGLAALIVAPTATPYLRVQRELDVARPVEELIETSLRPIDYAASWSWLHEPWLPNGSGAGGYFPGFVAAALTALGIAVAARRGERWPVVYALLGAAFVVLSLGPRLPWGSDELSLPYGLLYQYVPGFDGLRNPYRAAFIAAILFALPAGRGALWVIDRGQRRLGARPDRTSRGGNPRRAAWAVAIVLAGVHLLEAWPGPQEVAGLPRPGAAWSWLAEEDSNEAVLAWPLPRPIDDNARYQLWTIGRWRPLVNGHSGFYPPEFAALYELEDEFPQYRFLATLKEWFPVARVVADYGDVAVADGSRRRAAAAASEELSVVWREGGEVVYELGNGAAGGWLRRRLPVSMLTPRLVASVSSTAAGCALRVFIDGRRVGETDVAAGGGAAGTSQIAVDLNLLPAVDLNYRPLPGAANDMSDPGNAVVPGVGGEPPAATARGRTFVWLELMLVEAGAGFPVTVAAQVAREPAAIGEGVAIVTINGWPLVEGEMVGALFDGTSGRPKSWERGSGEGTNPADLVRRLLEAGSTGDRLALAARERGDPVSIERLRLLLDGAGGAVVTGPLEEVAATLAFVGEIGAAPETAIESLGESMTAVAATTPASPCASAPIRVFSFR